MPFFDFFNFHLKTLILFFNIKTRIFGAGLTALCTVLFFGPFFIERAKQLFLAYHRELAPKSVSKERKPTMGGVIILGMGLFSWLLWTDITKSIFWIALFLVIGFGYIGFQDDWQKIAHKRGITAKTKSGLQLFFALITIILLYKSLFLTTVINIPFLGSYDLGVVGYTLWALFIIIGTSNAVNLTDGLDGLAPSLLALNFMLYSLISFYQSGAMQELSLFCAGMAGATIGFLYFNRCPARIIMGDIGALPLGAFLGLVTLLTKQEILLCFSGFIFVVETISVIMQVCSYKIVGRRIFKMAPIHHHFELSGWSEKLIVYGAFFVTTFFSIVAILLFFAA